MPLIWGFYFDSLTLLFRFDLFLVARAKNPGKNYVGFLGDVKTPKGNFEIY